MSYPKEESFPAEELLLILGASVSRLALLDSFTINEAVRLSDQQFVNEDSQFFIRMAFLQNPVTGRYSLRPEWEARLLDKLVLVHPQAATDMADRLISRVIGAEVLDSSLLLNWMLHYRWKSTVRAAVAGVAAYSPFEITGGLQELFADESGVSPLRGLVSPYSVTAGRWLHALTSAERGSVADFSMLRALEYATSAEGSLVNRKSLHLQLPSRLEFGDGYLPIRAQLHLAKSSSRQGISIGSRSYPAIGGDADADPFASGLRALTARRRTGPGGSTAEHDASSLRLEVSESSYELLHLVMAERGPTQITETINLDSSTQAAERVSSISTSSSALVEGILFVYLGALPSTIGNALPIAVRALDGDRLVSGAGSIVSTYLKEMTAALAEISDDSNGGLSASDWARIDRSIREPWRFVQTARAYVDLSAIEVSWTEQVRSIGQKREAWPFQGMTGDTCILEGFRHGRDDNYTAKVSSVDSRVITAIELDTVPRPRDTRALERPSRLVVHSSWSTSSLVFLTLVVLASVASLFGLAAAAVSGRLMNVNTDYISFTLSAFSTIVGPIVAYLAASSFSRKGTQVNGLVRRVATVFLLWVALAIGTVFSGSDIYAATSFAVLDLLAGTYLLCAAGFSITSRLRRSAHVSRSIQFRSDLSEAARSWVLRDGWHERSRLF